MVGEEIHSAKGRGRVPGSTQNDDLSGRSSRNEIYRKIQHAGHSLFLVGRSQSILFRDKRKQSNCNSFEPYFSDWNLSIFRKQDETHTISAAVDENLVDSFVMKSTTPHDTTEIHGKIDRKGWKKIFVRIKYKTEVFKQLCEQHAYNVNFELNRLPYQLQHYALHFMEEHNLFSLLIDNPKYDEVDDDFIGFGKEEQSNIEFT